MDKLIISNNKIFLKYWSQKYSKYVITGISSNDLKHFLWEDIQINKNVTLKRIFEIMRPNVKFWASVLNENIEPLFDEMFNKECNYKNKKNLKYLEVCREIEYEFETGECESYHSFHACGEDTHETGAYYSVELSPVNSIDEIEIKINTEFKIYENLIGSKREWKFGSKNFKLLEFLKAIFWELCFYKNPDERYEFAKNLIGEESVV